MHQHNFLYSLLFAAFPSSFSPPRLPPPPFFLCQKCRSWNMMSLYGSHFPQNVSSPLTQWSFSVSCLCLDPSVFTMSLFRVWSVPWDGFVVIKPSLTHGLFIIACVMMQLALSLLCIPLRHRSAWVICLLCAVGELDCLPTERDLGQPRRKSFVAIGVFGTTIKCSFTLRRPGRQGI